MINQLLSLFGMSTTLLWILIAVAVAGVIILCIFSPISRIIVSVLVCCVITLSGIFCTYYDIQYFTSSGVVYGEIEEGKHNYTSVLYDGFTTFKFENLGFDSTKIENEYECSSVFNDKTININNKTLFLNNQETTLLDSDGDYIKSKYTYCFFDSNRMLLFKDDLFISLYTYNNSMKISVTTKSGDRAVRYWRLFLIKNGFEISLKNSNSFDNSQIDLVDLPSDYEDILLNSYLNERDNIINSIVAGNGKNETTFERLEFLNSQISDLSNNLYVENDMEFNSFYAVEPTKINIDVALPIGNNITNYSFYELPRSSFGPSCGSSFITSTDYGSSIFFSYLSRVSRNTSFLSSSYDAVFFDNDGKVDDSSYFIGEDYVDFYFDILFRLSSLTFYDFPEWLNDCVFSVNRSHFGGGFTYIDTTTVTRFYEGNFSFTNSGVLFETKGVSLLKNYDFDFLNNFFIFILSQCKYCSSDSLIIDISPFYNNYCLNDDGHWVINNGLATITFDIAK